MMINQPNGEQLKLEGMELVAQNNLAWIELILPAVIKAATIHTTFTIDDVRDIAAVARIQDPVSFRAWGSAMRVAYNRGLIEKVNCMPRKSTRHANHCRPQTVWRKKQ